MVSELLYSGVRSPLPWTQTKNRWSTDERMLQLFIWLTFSLNSKPFTYTFLLLIKRVNLKQNVRQSVRVYNLPSSQIASHLNKAPIKIQSLFLLIGFGSDRQTNVSFFGFITLKKNPFIYLFLERWEGREKERERNIDVRDTLIGCLLHAPIWGAGTLPTCGPRLGIQAGTFQFAGQHSIHWTTPARAGFIIF